MCRLACAQLTHLTDLLPLRVGLNRGETEVVCELVLFQVREDDGCEGGEERRAFVYRAVVDRVPYLPASVTRICMVQSVAHCLGASIEYGCAVEVLVIFDSIAVLDDALGAAVVRRCATVP